MPNLKKDVPKNLSVKNKVKAILENYQFDRSQLISMLQDIQAEYHYLPRQALVQVAELLEIPLTQIYGVATFFRSFSLAPRGKHTIYVCLGTACHVRGAIRVLEETERQLGITRGKTTPDKIFTLETVNCLGACALGPIMVVDGEYQGQMKTDKVKSVLNKYS